MDYNEWTSSRMESDISQYVSWRGGNGERERGRGRESISLDLQEGERERQVGVCLFTLASSKKQEVILNYPLR